MKSITSLQKHQYQPINESTNFIKIFFDFTYYLGVSPFRIVKTNGKKEGEILFQTYEWKPQKVFYF